jgi:hypothetical protein
MGMMIRFNQPEDYRPEIPAGDSCQSCVFVTKPINGVRSTHNGRPLAICRKFTGDDGVSRWLAVGDDGHPVRAKQCVEDYPYGATFAIIRKETP